MRSFVLIAVLSSASACLAEPFVEHVEPPSIARGQRQRIALVGRGLDRPLGLWTSLPTGKAKVVSAQASDTSRAELKLEVASDCPLGIYGLRLATEDGLSNLHLFAVDELSPQTQPPQLVKVFPLAIAGVLREAEVDRFPIEVSAGKKLTFEVVASRFGHDADPLLTIRDASGRRVVEHDNNPGLFFDCSFEHTFEQAGAYVVEVRDSRYLGSPHWQYVLRMGSFPVAAVALPSAVRAGASNVIRVPDLREEMQVTLANDLPVGSFFHAWRRPGDNASNWLPLLNTTHPGMMEVEPNNHFEQPTATETAPVYCHGHFGQPADKDFFALDLKKGDRLFVRAETKTIGSAADVELSIVDPMGREIQRVDDLQLPGGALDEASLTFGADRDGKYCVVVRETTGGSGPEYAYRIEVQKALPRIAVTANISAFTVPQRSYQSLPLSVARTDFTGPIELSLVNAPPGMKLEPTTIPEGATALLCRLSAAPDAVQGIYTLTIEAKGQSGEQSISTQVNVQPLIDKQVINVDLIKHALRDNQRHLPASVRDRLALQITPPIPHGVEIAEQTVTLPRYLQVPFEIATPRSAGFESPITFTALGQQLGEESEGRKQVFYRIPTVPAGAASTTASIHSRSQANEGKERVDIFAVTQHGSRQITLFRSLNLNVQPAFELAVEPAPLMLEPGSTAKVKLTAKRLPGVVCPITVRPTAFAGVTVPDSVEIASDQSAVEIDVVVSPECQPRRDRLRFPSSGQVGAFQEEPRQVEIDLEVKKPATK